MTPALLFRDFSEATTGPVATVVGFDPRTKTYTIGAAARQLGINGRAVAENFKRHVGDPDGAFEGRPSTVTPRPRLWSLGAESRELSELPTRRVVQIFLQQLFSDMPGLPRQLIVGVPATQDDSWQKNYRSHITLLLQALGQEEPLFFPEPFAVFQYYRHVAKLIPEAGQPLYVLVLDFGGGTFDCCVIETTEKGNLARGGSTAVPLGVQSVYGAGKEIDTRLVARAVANVGDVRLRKESVESRIAARPGILLQAEEMKIRLSARMRQCRLEDDYSEYVESRTIPPGFFHPDVGFDLRLTGEDLKRVVTDLWMERLGPAVLATVNAAKFRGRVVRFGHLDRIILAGGSSGLPFLGQLWPKHSREKPWRLVPRTS
jgi:molecular chaperone DnaK (HSP70)